ncbi:protein FAR1-RELATED SEQUENCE 5-like [Salvia hispanica]|uniref:protein FAR1-RELATED SEQUENCE 5-like n=1 Tax=Salvia hispanica TaxID=49212 RepID=UPI0020094DE1|nr:protein FAR1-RELATED SEQUENCE 5-like [Salvia hispanica]
MYETISEGIIPKIGMEFETEVEAYDAHMKYAKATGFGTRKKTAHKDPITGNILDVSFCCCREGFRATNNRGVTVNNPRPEIRCGCKAMMKINGRYGGRFRIVKFVEEHNHELCDPEKSYMFRCFRQMSDVQQTQVDVAQSCGLPPKKIIDVMAKEVGGIQHPGFTHIDLKNYLRTKRTLEIKQGDSGGVLQYLQRMISEDPHFYYAIQLDVEDLITNIFWTDGRMIQDFGHFGDVVCFDTTYRKHRDGRPIALFVGVNHHKQTTVFGAVLLYDETIETFEWLFGAFEDAMMGKRPKTILTDQDQEMSVALASKWPSTYHRLCVWHIFQNAAIHLSSVFSSFKNTFETDFSRCVYDFEEESEFLDAWNEMLEKYDLKDNQWLARMFSLKEKWALIYGRSTFCADIITTQRSECMNAVVKHYVNYKNNIVEVFHHFQSIYTMFALFNEELRKAFESKIESENQLGSSRIYKVRPCHQATEHTVSYDSIEVSISCSCRNRIPDEYILKRWTKHAKNGMAGSCDEGVVIVDEKLRKKRRYKELCNSFMQLTGKAAKSEDSYTYVIDCLLKMGNGIDGMAGKANNVTAEANNVTVEANKVGDISTDGDVNESQIKGVKPKGRVTYQM